MGEDPKHRLGIESPPNEFVILTEGNQNYQEV